MRRTQERRPGQGAAPKTYVTIDNGNIVNIHDLGTKPQPSAFQSFWISAGGFVNCTIIRRSDQPRWLTALSAGDGTATAFWKALWDWVAHAPEHRPICLSCEVTFTPRSLPTEWAMLTPLAGSPGLAMLSGMCDRCSV